MDDLEWDVKMYFAVNAAVHDAACEAWGTKRYYDDWRPIGCIRYLAGLGQSSDPALPSYNPDGLPLVTNLIELVTAGTVASGRHAGLTPGKIAVRAWPGPPANPLTQHSGVKWIHADTWSTYQRTNFVTPGFPGYFSGHSSFSRSAAEVLAGITGSPYFPGGLGTYTNYTLGFEQGPSVPLTLQWATYYDASDEAGISRIWGGIHPPIDNWVGRQAAVEVGQAVWALAQHYYDGSVADVPAALTIRSLNSGQCELRFTTLRGMYYRLQSKTNFSQTFTDEPGGPMLAYHGWMTFTNLAGGSQKFYRVVSSLAP